MSFILPSVLLLFIQDPDIDRLLKQLSEESVEAREAASKALIALGEKAEERVKRHSTVADPEAKARCLEILKRIDFGKKLAKVLPPPKRWTLASKGKSVKAVLGELSEKAGIPVDMGFVNDVPVEANLENLCFLEALDVLAKRADVEPYFGASFDFLPGGVITRDSAIKLRFRKGFCDAPRAYYGHYRVSVESVMLITQLNFKGPQRGTYELWLKVDWPFGLRPEGDVSINFTSAVDSKGVERYEYEPGDPEDVTRSGLNCDEFVFSDGEGCSFNVARGPIESLASLKGVVVLRYPVDRKSLKIENPKGSVGKTVDFDRFKVTLKEYKEENGEASLVLGVAGPGNETVDLHDLRAITTDGSTLEDRDSSMGGGANGGEVTFKRVYKLGGSRIRALEFVADTIWHKDKFEFELKGIQFPK